MQPQTDLVQIRVGKYDARRFAAKLKGDTLHIAQRVLDNLLANYCRACEGDLVDPG